MLHPDTEPRFVRPAIEQPVHATRIIPSGTLARALQRLDQPITPSL